MKLGDKARVTNPMRCKFEQEGIIKYISGPSEEGIRVVDLSFPGEEGHCVWSFVEDEIEKI